MRTLARSSMRADVGRDKPLVRAREGSRRKEPPERRRKREKERGRRGSVCCQRWWRTWRWKWRWRKELGPLRSDSWEPFVWREREESRTRLIPRDGSWLLVADARRVAPASPSLSGREEAGSGKRWETRRVGYPGLRSSRTSVRRGAAWRDLAEHLNGNVR